MYKIALLLSVVAMAAANPGLLAPYAVNTVVPGAVSTSAYSSSVVHPPTLYRAPLYNSALLAAPYPVLAPGVITAPYHSLHKRSIGYAPLATAIVSPVTYTRPVLSTYSAPLLASGYGYSPLYPRALSVHPY